MKLKYHKTLTKDKWSKFPVFRQILMIANELNRAKNWLDKNDLEETKNCYERGFELLDLTVSTTSNKNSVKEFLRFREVMAEQYMDITTKKNTEQSSKLSVLYDTLLLLNKDSYNLLATRRGN
ncbi:MAG: hypothetical protein Q7K21_07640 [Elusimicrobiota bacterium]|nr:hypothetical protein [Elusimicrobiota bacterium]